MNAVDGSQLASHRAGLNKQIFLLSAWCAVAGLSFGFAASVIASSLGQPNLARYFDFAHQSNLTGVIGAIAAVWSVGGAFGNLIISPIADRFGRKIAVLATLCLSVVGIALATGSVNITMLCFGRLFSGAGAYGLVATALTWQHEIAPARIRGALGTVVGISIQVGFVIAAWVGLGFYYLHEKNNWRWTLLLQLFFPMLVLAGVPFLPESPRWLVLRGRHEEALLVLKRMHTYAYDPEHTIAQEEQRLIIRQCELEKSVKSSWVLLFTKYKRRTFLGILVPVANQITGSSMFSKLITRLAASLGYSPSTSLIIAACWFLFGSCLSCVCTYLCERIGRKKPYVIGLMICSVWLAIEAALEWARTHGHNTPAVQKASLAAIFLWYTGYCLAEPIMFMYIGEIFPSQVRAKGTAVSFFALCSISVMTAVAQPTGQARIGWKFWLVFSIPTFFFACVLAFVMVETRGVPLEMIAAKFGETVAGAEERDTKDGSVTPEELERKATP